MLLETKTKSGMRLVVDMQSASAIEEQKDGATDVYLIGDEDPMRIDMPFEEVFKAFEKKSSGLYSNQPDRKTKFEQIPVMEFGTYKIQFEIITTEYENGASTTLKLQTNFPIKGNVEFQNAIREADGVENFAAFSSSWAGKYSDDILVAKLFDPKDVVRDVKEAIVNFLSK